MQPISHFSNGELERNFQLAQNRRLGQQDIQVYFLGALLFIGSFLGFLVRESGGLNHSQQLRPLVSALPFLAAAAFHRLAPELYLRYRTGWVTMFRLMSIFLPQAARGLGEVYSEERLEATPASLPAMLMLSAQLLRAWALALGLRLSLYQHILLSLLQTARLIFNQALLPCETSYVKNPATLERVSALARSLTGWTGLLLPGLGPSLADEGSEGQAVAHCYAIIVAMHLLFGLVLPMVAVYIEERRSRRDYFAAMASSSGAEGVADAVVRMGLPTQEIAEVCLFDSVAAWARCVSLLPVLAAVAWPVALMLSTRLYPEAAQGLDTPRAA